MIDVLFGILVFLLMSVGVSHLWSHADVFSWPRNKIARHCPSWLRMLFLCPECASFWIGMVVSFLFNPLAGVLVYKFHLLSHIMCGVITYLFASFLYKKSILE